MKKYYIFSERGFANETTIVSASTETQVNACEKKVSSLNNDPNAWGERITRKAAEHETAMNRRAYRDGTANANNPAGATEITPAVEYFAIRWC